MELKTGPEFNVPRTVSLKNTHCPYCGTDLSIVESNKDHVIARKLAPKGSFSKHWNLVLRTCITCNTQKSKLENDISAILMAMHCFGFAGMSNEEMQKEAQRKAFRSISRKTGKPVAKSNETLNLQAIDLGGISLSFGLIAPPQIEPIRAFELARLQLMGFYYMLTYDGKTNRGFFWPHGFHPLNSALKSDWGNIIQRDFASVTHDWHHRLALTTASGYYKARIKKHPNKELWAWALEWNEAYRLIGFFGERHGAEKVVESIRSPTFHTLKEKSGGVSRFREEQTLDTEQDTLFD